jgi:predicted ArsR family transcriptional regulator
LGASLKRAYHPKAFLTLKRNIQPGLVARTQIVLQIEKGALSAKAIAQNTDLSYTAALYHLHLLEAENILVCKGKKPYLWELTGAGQQRLT